MKELETAVKKFKEIGIYPNMDKPDSPVMTDKIVAYLMQCGYKVILPKWQITSTHEGVSYYPKSTFFKKIDCLIVLGGDGTLLSVAVKVCAHGIPILGINLGKLGFLTEGEAGDYEETLNDLIKGHFHIEKRMMLTCTIKRENERTDQYIALNDVLIKGKGVRMMEMEVRADEGTIDKFRADGLIIATATGSTAYSLAAGGPVVSPKANVMILNPICPHRLHDRSYVLPGEEIIHLQFAEENEKIKLTFDGQTTISLTPRDAVSVQKSTHFTHLIRLNQKNSYDRLRIKLSSEC